MERGPSRSRQEGVVILFAVFHRVQNDVGTLFDSQRAGIQADVIILGQSPGASGVVLVIQAAAFVPGGNPGFRILFVGVGFQNSGDPGGNVRMEVDIQNILPLF